MYAHGRRAIGRCFPVTIWTNCGLRIARHGTHFNLDQALEAARKIGARRTFLTHLGHDFGYKAWSRGKLPKGVEFAYDGLVVREIGRAHV